MPRCVNFGRPMTKVALHLVEDLLGFPGVPCTEEELGGVHGVRVSGSDGRTNLYRGVIYRPGPYVVEAVEDDAPALTPEEEAGIEAALESYRQGCVIDSKRAREIIDAALGR